MMKTFHLKAVIPLCVGLAITSVAIAKDAESKVLDAKAVKSLASDRMWQSKRAAGPGYHYWSWKSDGSVCFREDKKIRKCFDTGTWKLEGDRLCYELTWWGATIGMKSRCFRIADKGNGRYEKIEDSGLSTIEFSVAK